MMDDDGWKWLVIGYLSLFIWKMDKFKVYDYVYLDFFFLNCNLGCLEIMF